MKRKRMFRGLTRQIIISEETHQRLSDAARAENKYMGELADELIQAGLAPQPSLFPRRPGQDAPPVSPTSARTTARAVDIPPVDSLRPVERLSLQAPYSFYKLHCLVCDREWISEGRHANQKGVQDEGPSFPRRCHYEDCRAYCWNDPIAAPAARRKRERRQRKQL